MNNLILDTDSYKYSMWNQYPQGTTRVYSYIESRGGQWDKVVMFGALAFIKKYLTTPITQADVDEAELLITAHGLPFYREGWEYIVNQLDGKLPVEICAVPDGTVVGTNQVLLTIVNTDDNCWWLTTFLETALLRGVWYPTTVATNSWHSKQIIREYLERTGDPNGLAFKLHDFGSRGVSSKESAGLGGMAHLVNFMGTDTVTALQYAIRYYNADVAGFSIPAMEHSTVTSWGREGEVSSFRNMLKRHAKPGGLVACVSDSYDIYQACHNWGTELKSDVINSGATLVVRPDSGDPATVVLGCLQILESYFGSEVNSKGYRVLNHVRVIQGDGINHDSIREILHTITDAGFSADNVAFGQGGALLQQVNRDTLKFAMKCSAAMVNGKWVDVFKDPVTDSGKRSKKGLVKLYKDGDQFVSGVNLNLPQALVVMYRNGELMWDTTFDDVRARANQ